MPSPPDAGFARDMACTEAEWLAWLPGAVGSCPWTLQAGQAEVRIGAGRLTLDWQPQPDRVIGSLRLPRLRVNFRFDGVPDDARHAFMTRFDLYMQRGGG